MCAKFISAWLCAAAGAVEELEADVGAADDVASFVAELLQALIATTAASAAIPVTTVLVFPTTLPFVIAALLLTCPDFPALSRAVLAVL
jgi:hypothetical protein